MRLLKTYEEYSAFLGRMFKIRRFDTNHFISAEEMKRKIEYGHVYIEEGDRGAWILADDGRYYLAYLYLIYGGKVPDLNEIEKPALAELIGTSTRYCKELESALLTHGFQMHATNLELISDLEDGKKAEREARAGKRFFVRHGFTFHDMTAMNDRYFDEIWKLWLEHIDPFAVRELTGVEYDEMVKNGRGVFVTDQTGTIVGAGYYEKNRTVGAAHHIAVCKKYNGVGLGGVIMNECASKAFQEGVRKYVSWISEDNWESLRIHKSIGKLTGKFAKQFILQEGEMQL